MVHFRVLSSVSVRLSPGSSFSSANCRVYCNATLSMELILGIQHTALPAFPFTFGVYGLVAGFNTVQGMKGLNVFIHNRHSDSAFSPPSKVQICHLKRFGLYGFSCGSSWFLRFVFRPWMSKAISLDRNL